MREKVKALFRRLLDDGVIPGIHSREPSVSIEQGIADYFATAEPGDALAMYAAVRSNLEGRKLIRKERRDKGGVRVKKSGISRDVPSSVVASQELATAIVDGTVRA